MSTYKSSCDNGENFYAVGDINSKEKGSGARANKGKPALSLVPLHLVAGAARVFMYGLIKYAPWNWAKGMDWSIPMDCLLRHIFKWWFLGEECDKESGLHHLDHAMCNLLMLRHYDVAYKEGDDRPPAWTGFPEEMDYFNTLWDTEEFLRRNPQFREKAKENVCI